MNAQIGAISFTRAFFVKVFGPSGLTVGLLTGDYCISKVFWHRSTYTTSDSSQTSISGVCIGYQASFVETKRRFAKSYSMPRSQTCGFRSVRSLLSVQIFKDLSKRSVAFSCKSVFANHFLPGKVVLSFA